MPFYFFRELRKRINGFNNVELQWRVHESIDQLQGQELDPEKLYPDYASILDFNIHQELNASAPNTYT